MLCLGPWTWVHRSFCCNFFEKEIWSQYFVHNWEFIFSKFVDNQFIFKEVTTKRSMDQSLRTQDWLPSVLSLRRLCYVHFIALRLLFLFAIYLHISAGITRLQLMTKWGFFETQYICVFIHRVSKNCAKLFFAPCLSNMNRFQQKLEELSWNKPSTKLCLKCPLHVKYVLALPWESWSARMSRQRNNEVHIWTTNWIATNITGSYC